MKRLIALAMVSVLSATAAFAQSAPAGWLQDKDGYEHVASGMRCPANVGGYAFTKIGLPSDLGFEGVCTYGRSDGETGLIRIRHYIEGVGETPLAIQNDYGLMHPGMTGTPGTLVGAYRGGPGPVVGGNKTYQYVLTTTRNSYLIDCIARHTAVSTPPTDFVTACQKLAN